MTERRWQTGDFDYQLPAELIAQLPAERRDASRLLTVHRERPGSAVRFDDGHFVDLAALIPPGDLLVLNSTRVRHARLVGSTPAGNEVEVLLLHPLNNGDWLAMGRPGRALKPGRRVILDDTLSIEVNAVRDDGYRVVRFDGGSADDAMNLHGRLPLPPYVDHLPGSIDEERYQTVYAEREGSVAAPTAGLHFTAELLGTLRDNGVAITSLDLEVGPGTFRPVEVDDPSEHPMHRERFCIDDDAAGEIRSVRQRGGDIWAVGTTVVRALESAANDDRTVRAGDDSTGLLIIPGYRFKVVDRLLTNFHLPRSTLLMLVAAFAGHATTMEAYRHAVAERYRFYSYGDAMCII